jgi:hypothetical protein
MKLTGAICLGTFFLGFSVAWAAISRERDNKLSKERSLQATSAKRALDTGTSPAGKSQSSANYKSIGVFTNDWQHTTAPAITLPSLSDLDQEILQDPKALYGDAAALKGALTLAVRQALADAKSKCLSERPAGPSVVDVRMRVTSSRNEARINGIEELHVVEGAPVDVESMECLARLARGALAIALHPPVGRKFVDLVSRGAAVS